MRFSRCLLVLTPLLLAAPGLSQDTNPGSDVVLDALAAELERSFAELKDHGPAPLYFLSYTVVETDRVAISAEEGALTHRPTPSLPDRVLRVEARVGSHELDNTHQIRGGGGFGGFSFGGGSDQFPAEDDPDAIRVALWRATDEAFKQAQEQFGLVKTNRVVMVEEEDKSSDFTAEEPAVHLGELARLELDRKAWQEKVRRYSALLKGQPHLLSTDVTLRGETVNRWFVSSEGSRIRDSREAYRLGLTGEAKAEDGMELYLYESFEAPDEASLPTDEEVARKAAELSENLKVLLDSPLVEPFAGPAILTNRAAAVFFHEIFGHRIEGHRQKDVEEGQTFTKKVGKRIMPEFISIVDDPTSTSYSGHDLWGHYGHDDEGVPAQAVTVVEKGVLRNFLMCRSPVEGFPSSNGHGRAQAGMKPVARQANLLIASEHRVPFAELREMLIAEAQKQGKPYGLIFQDIAGGFTMTQRFMPQTYKVLPLLVTRVYVDGRPDEVVRGVDIVGTPIASLEQIIATGDDDAAFHGFCGAESGSVPVSAVSPSMLLRTIEVEKRQKEQDRPPILPRPGDAEVPDGEDVLLKALQDELARSTSELTLEDYEPPYYVALRADETEQYSVQASFGALTSEGGGTARGLSSDVRVGTYELDNTNYSGGGFSLFGGSMFMGGGGGLPLEDDYRAFRTAAWRQIDPAYKGALETLAQKRAELENMEIEDRPDDFSREEPVTHLQEPVSLEIDKGAWKDRIRNLSAVFRDFPGIHSSSVALMSGAETRRLVSSEGFLQRTGETLVGVIVSASTQCEDGMPLSDHLTFGARTPADLPPQEKMESAVRAVAERLQARREAPEAEDYTGPVLFEGEAAAEFFLGALGHNLGAQREQEGGGGFSFFGGVRLNDKLGKRILPKFINVIDDPTIEEVDGVQLLGSYPVDEDGIPPQRVEVVKEGRLEALLTDRVPTRETKGSNGHNRGNGASMGCLFVEATETSTAAELKAELLELAEDEDLEYGIIVRKLQSPLAALAGGSFNFFSFGGGGDITLPAPVEMVRVYVEDGREEPVRGGSFGSVTLRVLRDIVAVGEERVVYNGIGMGDVESAVVPSVLVEMLSLREPPEDFEKPPILTNPYFDKE